ncbi:hypothetical protein Tco_0269599 [Tanacetum coccineum]
MAFKSLTPTQNHVTPGSNVNFKCRKGVVAFNSNFSIIIGLNYSEKYDALLTKETVKAALETLGLEPEYIKAFEAAKITPFLKFHS